MASQQQPKVLIIGGGIGGPALALFLHKAGIDCAVYEAYPYTEDVGGGLNIAPNGMSVLDALGLAGRIKTKGTPVKDFIFQSEKARTLARFVYGAPAIYKHTSVSIMRSTLYEELAADMKAAGIPVNYEKRLVGIQETETGVTAQFEDGTTVDGHLLVGADGVHSFVRHYLLPNGPEPAYVGLNGLGGFPFDEQVEGLTKNDTDNLFYTFGPNGFFGYGASDNGRMMWWANTPQEREYTREELAHTDLEEFKRELAERYKDYAAPIPALIRATPKPFRQNIYDVQSLPYWYKGRVVLMGDAAHAVSPNAGQGASQALEDAMYLGKVLRDAGGDYEWAFAQYERERRPRAEKVVAEGRSRGAGKDIVSPFQSAIRNLLISFFVSRNGKKGLDWMIGYKIDWDSKTYPDLAALKK